MSRKWGEGSLMAAWRQGGKEFGQALNPFPNGQIQMVDEPGTFWTPTQQQVSLQTGAYNQMREQRHRPVEMEM